MQKISLTESVIYVTTTIVILISFLWYQQAVNEQLRFLLTPTVLVSSLFTGLPFIWETDLGYTFLPLKIVIDRSCAGVRFLLLVWGMSVFLFLHHFHTWMAKMGAVVGFSLTAYCCTILANACRITGAIFLLRLTPHLPLLEKPAVHQAEGILFYLTFLIAYFFTWRYYLNADH